MYRQAIVIAKKEIIDHAREVRSILASVMHLLIGPALVLMVSFSGAAKSNAKGASVLAGMMSIFTLVAAFVGGMNVAMDVVAGERERRSLLPLLLNPVSRGTVIAGKWIATSVFSLAGLAITVAAFAAVCKIVAPSNPLLTAPALVCWILLGLLPLAILAAALQVAISTVSRTAKEAQTYLSLLIFVPMGVSMFLLFFPRQLASWAVFIPIAGQQLIAQSGMNQGQWSIAQAFILAVMTTALAALTVLGSGRMLRRDSVVYGS
jgi:sodium transport system permease protein